MEFLNALTSGASSIGKGASNGLSIGRAVSTVADAKSSRAIVKANAKTSEAFAKVNARRIARDQRFQQGSAAVAAAAGGGGQYGTTLAIFADNARASEENRQSALLNQDLSEIAQRGQLQTNGEVALSLTNRLLGASVTAASNSFNEENL